MRRNCGPGTEGAAWRAELRDLDSGVPLEEIRICWGGRAVIVRATRFHPKHASQTPRVVLHGAW